MSISAQAIVHPEAHIGKDVRIDPFASVDRDVVIGDGSWVGSHAMVMPGSRLGTGCQIFPGAILGGVPQDLKYDGEPTTLELESGVTIREYCTINKGTRALGKTVIHENALIMAYAHVAHDCIIGRSAIVANAVNLAGHVTIGPNAIVGGMTAVHQFVNIGRHSFIGGGTLVRKDVPPFVKAAREPLAYVGVNSVGLRRHGYNLETINRIKDIYRLLFVLHKNISFAIEEIEALLEESPEKEEIIQFITASSRGLIRGFQHGRRDAD